MNGSPRVSRVVIGVLLLTVWRSCARADEAFERAEAAEDQADAARQDVSMLRSDVQMLWQQLEDGR